MADHGLDDAAMVGVVVVERELVGDPQADEEGDGQAGGEAEDIDERIALLRRRLRKAMRK